MEFIIKNREIVAPNTSLIGDNADYVAHFNFDDEWNGLVKTARFEQKGEFMDVLLDNDTCTIPSEILKKGYVKVGVFSDKMATTSCSIYIIPSIKETDGSPLPPSNDIYNQIIEKLNSINNETNNETIDEVELDNMLNSILGE